MERGQAARLLARIRENIGKVIVGKGEVVDQVLAALLCGGHVLIEDVPGLGKTTLAAALSQSLGCSWQRVQFTPDVVPSDITGYTAFHLKTGEQEFHQGAVMSQILLADEINRTSPKTQSALLQAMQEGQVTVDGQTYRLPRPFLVLATQNPVELTGTYPLPEAQLDRFLLRISVGYPKKEEEVDILRRNRERVGARTLEPVAGAEEVGALQALCDEVRCATPVLSYIVDIATQTRKRPEVALGVSPRGSIGLMRASMARAMLQGRDFVIPDDVQEMALPVLCHRIVMQPQASFQNQTPESVVGSILRTTAVPAVRVDGAGL